MPDLRTTTYAVLGLLANGPMSGYSLVGLSQDSIAHFWPLTKSQAYSELSRLEDLGYVTSRQIRQESLPDKREYEMTKAGREALNRWLDSPGFEPDRFRSGFLVKVFFANLMDHESLLEMLERYRKETEEYRARLAMIVKQLDSVEGADFMRATAEYGAQIHAAAVEWAKKLESRTKKGGKRA